MKPSDKKTGRFAFDARGLPRWDEQTATGEYRPRAADSPQTRALKADELSIADSQPHRILHNPYGNRVQPKTLKSRSPLDYLRALSEAIKTKRRVSSEGDGY